MPISYDHLRVTFAANGGTDSDVPYEKRIGGSYTTGNYTLSFASAPVWTTEPGWITPNGTCGIILNDQSLDPLFRLDNLSGGLAVMFRIKKTIEQAASRHIFQWGAPVTSSSVGGMVFRLTTDGTLRAQVYGKTTNTAFAGETHGGTVEKTVLMWIDMALGMLRVGFDGNFLHAQTEFDIRNITTGNLPSTTAGDYAFSLLSGHGTGATVPTQDLNLTTGDAKIRDFIAVRFPTDEGGKIAQVFSDYHADTSIIPEALQ